MQMKFLKCITTLFLLVSTNLPAHDSIGISEIRLDSQTKLTMPNILKPGCYGENRTEEVCLPHTVLTLIYKNKSYLIKHPIAPWEGSFFIYFVKLRANSYAVDLDENGFKEVAIYPAVCGNSPKSMAYIYTVKKNELIPYGTGVYFWEAETPVKNIKKNPNFKPDI